MSFYFLNLFGFCPESGCIYEDKMRTNKPAFVGLLGAILWIMAPVGKVLARSEETSGPVSGSNWGYIGIGALILVAIIYILIKKQHRRFNE